MITKTCVAVFCLALAIMLASCGGGGTNQALMGSSQPSGNSPAVNPLIDGGQNSPTVRISEWEMGDLPGTIPDEPKDIAAVFAQADANAQKATSALLSTILGGSVSTTTPVGDGFSHDFVASDGMVWAEAQDISVETEYHAHGTVTNLELEPGGVSYATIGLVDWFTYDFATTAGESAYMFNQNVYLMIRRDINGVYWVRLADYNTKWGSHETAVNMPFDFDLMLEPIDPIQSIPHPEDPSKFLAHYIGLATLKINGTTLGSSVIYGDNSWGWYRADRPEQFDMANGGAMLMGQVYASGDAITSTLDFTATLESGPLATDPSDWWCYGQNRTNHRLSRFNGPQNGTPLWTFTGFGGGGLSTDSPPVVGADGTIYTGCGDGNMYAINADGTLKWTTPLAGLGTLSSPLVGVGGTLYVVSNGLPAISSITDNGATGSLNWTLPLDADTYQHPAMGADGVIYIATNAGTLYAIRDDGVSPTVMWTRALTAGFTFCAPTIANDGTIYISSFNGPLYSIRDNGASSTLLGTYPNVGFYSSPVIAPDGTVYIASIGSVTALTDNGAGFTLKWSLATGLVAPRGGMALGPAGQLYVKDADSSLISVTDNGASGSLNWIFNSGSQYGSMTVSADGIIYLSSNVAPHATEHIALVDNGGSASLLWSNFIGEFMGFGAASIMVADGRLIASSSDGTLIAYEDVGPVFPVTIDCSNLPAANFYLHRPDDTVISGPHDTDVLYNASGDVADGDQFYLSFDVDVAQSPNDLVIYPSVPATGLITVNPANLGIDFAIAPYYTNLPASRTLVLNSGTYNRVTNDVTSLGHALYSLRDIGTNNFFGGPFDTDSSGTDQVILRDGIIYRPMFSEDAYPVAGSDPAFNGGVETIYPVEWIAGNFLVIGDILGGGAAATVIEQGTVLGDYFTQAGLVNTMDSDAFCRFDVDMTGTPFNYGYWDDTIGTWIVPLGNLSYLANPRNTAAFARGTRFQVRNTAPGGSTVAIEVSPGQLLDGAASVTRGMGFAGSVTLNVLPVRVWDDPALPDPSASMTWAGAGWDVGVNFLMQYGQGPYTVEFDADYGVAWDDGTAGRVYALDGSPFTTTGLFSDNVSIPLGSQPGGNYNYAIRVTDNNGDQYTYIWSDILPLALPSGWVVASPSPDTTDDTGLHTSMMFINGNPAIAYYNFTNGDLGYVRSTDPFGGEWGTPVVVDSTDDVGRYCSLAVIGGNPAIGYYDITNGYLMYARAADADGADWSGPGSTNVIVDQDPPFPFVGSGVGQFCSLADVNGKPAISYYAASFAALEYARSHDSLGADWSGATAIDVIVHSGGGSAGWDTSLAVINGKPAISYHVRTGGRTGDLWYARSDDVDGASWLGGTTIRVMVDDGGPSPGGPVGEYTSLTEVNGRPAISYYIARTFGDVRYARAGDADGSTWDPLAGATLRTVQTGGINNVGLHTSLEIIAGFPAVSYYDATNGDLMYTRSNDLNGSVWGANEVADSAGFTGGYTSLIEVSGEPAISYYDFTNGDLEFAKRWP